jgi:steroid delta-isomerase-like uncharacterized protein
MAYDNAALVRRIFNEVWSQGKLSVIDELIAANGISHDPIVGELRGAEPLKAQVREYRNAFPDLHFAVEELVASGETVVARWTGTGTHKGPMLGAPATGKSAAIGGISIYKFENGKCIEHWTQWDTLKFLQTLGLVPPLGQRPATFEQPEARH